VSDIRWGTYEDSEKHFSIKYPSSWYYFSSAGEYDEVGGGYFVLFSSALGNTSLQVRTEDEEARLAVSVAPNGEGSDVEAWLAGSPLLEGEVSRLSLAGVNAVRISSVGGLGEEPVDYISLFLTTASHRFSLIGTIAHSEDAVLWNQVILQMQESFRLE
jgi:hypothetical protein